MQGADTILYSVHVVDVDNPGAPKFVGHGFGIGWFDNTYSLVDNTRRSYIASLAGDSTRPFFRDSCVVWSLWDMHHLVYYDIHPGKTGWWVIETERLDGAALWNQQGDVVMPTLRGAARKISSAPSFFRVWTSFSASPGFVIQYAGPGKVRQIWFTGRREEILPPTFSGLVNRSLGVNPDGKEVVFVSSRLSSRLVLLQNVFK